ncbi:hypothetical protein EA462_09340 [Natrarchaeobius halalkaliphilus]|uniref:Uncharacterized protein n=1 Tax=Natrarchaeobius halalkaliphilus TaxID=1679091 RepID=A0A3N6MXE7_9EURY|nr:hypothetical protein EA462_09340 [Natrarchaeobius halalkaliphilus]
MRFFHHTSIVRFDDIELLSLPSVDRSKNRTHEIDYSDSVNRQHLRTLRFRGRSGRGLQTVVRPSETNEAATGSHYR